LQKFSEQVPVSGVQVSGGQNPLQEVRPQALVLQNALRLRQVVKGIVAGGHIKASHHAIHHPVLGEMLVHHKSD
jgi:hypothetical protein